MRIFFSVGEPSGDLHGANLIQELRRRRPDLECVGYGGPLMAAAGCRLHFDLTQLAVMWLVRVVLNLHKFLGLLRQADRYFRDHRPDAVLLIDYPGFNWWIARRAKARGIRVFYYGTPQMWAWGGWRVKKMKRFVDHVLCKLPFEVDWFCARGCNATYVGHPYFDETTRQRIDSQFLASLRGPQDRLITILPGSRTQEVTLNLPVFLDVARRVVDQIPDVRLAIASYNAAQAELARALVASSGLSMEVYVDRTPDLIAAADCCLACSGSVSLELLYHRKPTVIHYRISRLIMLLQRALRRVKYVTLVNLLATDSIYQAGGRVFDPDAAGAEDVPFPEYVTVSDKSQAMAAHLVRWLSDEPERLRRIGRLNRIADQFALPGASRLAAEYILQRLTAIAEKRRACA